MKISEILKDTNYKLTQFKKEYQDETESLIFQKEVRGKQTNFINCLVRKKDIQVKPEEKMLSYYKDLGKQVILTATVKQEKYTLDFKVILDSFKIITDKG